MGLKKALISALQSFKNTQGKGLLIWPQGQSRVKLTYMKFTTDNVPYKREAPIQVSPSSHEHSLNSNFPFWGQLFPEKRVTMWSMLGWSHT